jgi:hypothetical protein
VELSPRVKTKPWAWFCALCTATPSPARMCERTYAPWFHIPPTHQLDPPPPSPTAVWHPECRTKPRRLGLHGCAPLPLPLTNAPRHMCTPVSQAVHPSIRPPLTFSHRRLATSVQNQALAARFAHLCTTHSKSPPPSLKKHP